MEQALHAEPGHRTFIATVVFIDIVHIDDPADRRRFTAATEELSEP